MTPPADNRSWRIPVSIKGVLLIDGKVPLLMNERGEWELPGGKLEPGEAPVACCVRELEEELNVRARIGRIVDAWVYVIDPSTHVLIVTYGCVCLDASALKVSHEHKQLALFHPSEVPTLNMPGGYKDSIAAWVSALRMEAP